MAPLLLPPLTASFPQDINIYPFNVGVRGIMATVEVIVDVREAEHLVDIVKSHPDVSSYDVQMLEIGDLIIDSEVCIERKTIGDFVDSMHSGHLEDQIHRMWMGFEYVHLLVAGNLDDFGDDYWSNTPPKAVRGFCASLSQRWDVTPLFCSTDEFLVDMAVRLGRKAKEPIERQPTGPSVSVKDEMDAVVQALMLVDGISTKRAETIAEHYDNVGAICQAEEEDLVGIPGVGGKTAQNIKEKLHD